MTKNDQKMELSKNVQNACANVFLDEKSCAFHEYVRYELSDAREQRARMRKRTHERLSEANAIDNVLAAKEEAAATEEQVAPDEADRIFFKYICESMV